MQIITKKPKPMFNVSKKQLVKVTPARYSVKDTLKLNILVTYFFKFLSIFKSEALF